jgi:hypothetical protein
MYSQREVEAEVEHPHQISVYGLLVVAVGKETACMAEDLGFLSRLL